MKEFIFYYMLLILSVNTHSLFFWKIKKVSQLLMLFKEILDKSNHKLIKMWVDIQAVNSWLMDNDTEMYLTHNEGKSVAAERFFRTLKNKTDKYTTSISKCILINHMIKWINTTMHVIEQLKWSQFMQSQAHILTLLNKIKRKLNK